MALKSTAEFRLRAWPATAIPGVVSTPFGFADTIGDLLLRDRGEGGGDDDTETWKRQKAFSTIGKYLRFIDFKSDKPTVGVGGTDRGNSGDFAGLCLTPQTVWVHSRIDGDTFRAPDSDKTYKTIRWRGVKGPRWRTAQADRSPRVTGIYHAAQLVNTDVVAETIDYLPPNQQIRLDLSSLQVWAGQTQKARIRVEWGGGYSLLFPQDASATVERHTADGANWASWKELTALGPVQFKGDWTIFVERIAGRLVVRVNEQSFSLMDVRDESDPDVREIKWPRSRLRVTLYGVSARVELALLNYDHINDLLKTLPKKVDRLTGIRTTPGLRDAICVQRSVLRNGAGTLDSGRAVAATGWRHNGSSLLAGYDSAEPVVGTSPVPYTVALVPSPDGHETPFLTTIQGRHDGSLSTPTEDALDLSAAYLSHTETTAEPGVTAGAEISVEISRSILDTQLPGWDETIAENVYNPVAFSVRYRNDDGTYTPWVTRLKGYIWQINKTTGSYGDDKMTLVLRDPMLRFKAPSGIIDETYPVGGMIYARSSKAPVYAGEILKAIVEHVLGADEAARMNGNGDPLRYSPPETHIPLMSWGNDVIGYYDDGTVPQSSVVPFAPPYWDDAMSWMEKLAKDDTGGNDTGIMLFGYPTGDGANNTSDDEDVWPCFIYGDVREILNARSQWTIPDAIYNAGDQNMALEMAETQSRPEHDYNTWVVANTQPGVDKGILPAIDIGRDQLQGTDPRRPGLSWPRTAVIELNTYYSSQNYVQSIAALLALDSTGAAPNNPQFTFRADPRVQWGDLVFIKQMKIIGVDGADESDMTIPINDWFRIIRLTMKGDGASHSYMAEAVCTTLSAFEKASLSLE